MELLSLAREAAVSAALDEAAIKSVVDVVAIWAGQWRCECHSNV